MSLVSTQRKAVVMAVMVVVVLVAGFSYFATAQAAVTTQTIQLCVKNSGAAFVIGEGFKVTDPSVPPGPGTP